MPPPVSVPPVAAPAPPPPAPTVDDPHALAPAVARLTNSARKSARVALAIVSATLDDGEVVVFLVAGEVDGLPGIAVLTTNRLVLVNERQWRPDRIEFALDSSLTVRGEAAGADATLTIEHAGRTAVIAKIGDVPLAQEMAQRIRARAAG